MKRNICIIEDLEGKKIVVINDLLFKGRQFIKWKDVEKYLKQFIGDMQCITKYGDEVYIGNDLPNEYAHSRYAQKLKGKLAKAKANASQGIHEIIEIASNKRFVKNFKRKHENDAKYGWYRYDTRFALPVCNEKTQEIERYNIFRATLIIKRSDDDKLYLYDVINMKKEPSTPLEL